MEKNELVVIEESNALSVLSSESGVEGLVSEVRERVMSLEGGNLKTGVGRKQIKSNAFKATKAKSAIDEQHIQPLIDSVTKKIQPDLDTIQALKNNRKRLNEGLDQIRKDVNAEVQAIEDEIQRKIDEEEARVAAVKLSEEINRDHEMAELMNAEFDRKRAEIIAEELRVAAEFEVKLEKERLEREALIAQQAKEQAEQEAKQREAKLEQGRLDAIAAQEQAKRDAIAAEERAKLQAEQAEIRRQEEAKRAEEFARQQAEAAKQAEIKRQQDELDRQAAELARREADKAHQAKINNGVKQVIMTTGVSEELAVEIVKALYVNSKTANPLVTINY